MVGGISTEVYPEAPNVWDALGQAYLMVRRREDARQAFARAVELAEEQGHLRLPQFRANPVEGHWTVGATDACPSEIYLAESPNA